VQAITLSAQVIRGSNHRPAGIPSSVQRRATRKSQALNQFRYRKDLIVIYQRWFTFLPNTMRENAHGETDPR
jgi:hypothetical protein